MAILRSLNTRAIDYLSRVWKRQYLLVNSYQRIMPRPSSCHLPWGLLPAAQGEKVQVRAVQEGPSPRPPRFGSIQETEVHSSLLTLCAEPRGGDVPSFSSSCTASIENGERMQQQAQRLLNKSTLVPKETKWKPPLRMESALCAEMLLVICKLKAPCESVMAIPHPEAGYIQTHRIRGFSLVLCSLWSLNCSFVETKQRERISDWNVKK